MDFEKGMEEFNKNFPYALREHAVAHGLFGGEFILEKMNPVDKLITQKVNKQTKSVSKLNLPAIEVFIEKMKAEQEEYAETNSSANL
jgi:menaquinone-dependent protoporphyrinogen oxidase